MKVFIQITEHTKRVFVEASLGTNGNTMRALARKKMNATQCPDYVNTVTGERSPGIWAQSLGSSAEWKSIGGGSVPTKKLYWELVVMRDWTKK